MIEDNNVAVAGQKIIIKAAYFRLFDHQVHKTAHLMAPV